MKIITLLLISAPLALAQTKDNASPAKINENAGIIYIPSTQGTPPPATALNERELFRKSQKDRAAKFDPKSLYDLDAVLETAERLPADFSEKEWANRPLKLVVGQATINKETGQVVITPRTGGPVTFSVEDDKTDYHVKDVAKIIESIKEQRKALAIFAETDGKERLFKLTLGGEEASYEVPSPSPKPAPVVPEPSPAPTPVVGPSPTPPVQPQPQPHSKEPASLIAPKQSASKLQRP